MAGGDDCLVKHAEALKKALREGAFKEAEALIRNSWNPKCLSNNNDDDHPESLPLTLVLSGEAGYFNLHLAALLVQHGADLNARNVETSPLEHVIKMYLDAKALCDKQEASHSQLTIGLNGEINPPPLKLKEQLSVLMDMLLASGANPNLITYFSKCQSVLHKVVAVENPDIDVVMKLYRWGGNFDTGDLTRTTPLMDHIIVASRDRGLPLIDKILCEVIELDLNATNIFGETMLVLAMLSGSPAIAVRLLQCGADPTKDLQGSFFGNFLSIYPIFAPLLQFSALYSSLSISSFSVPGLNKAMLCSVFPVVDCTDICHTVSEKLDHLLSNTHFPMSCLTDREYCRLDVAFLMFGHFKAGLQQLCVRKIMEHLIVTKCCFRKDIMGTVTREAAKRYLRCGIKQKSSEQRSLVVQLTPRIIANLRTELRLPATVEPRFLIEAARLQVGTYFFDNFLWSRQHCTRFCCH